MEPTISEKSHGDLCQTSQLEGEISQSGCLEESGRQPSISDIEKVVLRAFQVGIKESGISSLSVSEKKSSKEQKKTTKKQSIEIYGPRKEDKHKIAPEILEKRIKSKNHIGLWKSYEDGVKPSTLLKGCPSIPGPSADDTKKGQEESESFIPKEPPILSNIYSSNLGAGIDSSNNANEESELNKEEVNSTHSVDIQVYSSDVPSEKSLFTDAESWDEADGGINHYDAWQIMKDEYAQDAGFFYVGEETGDVESADTGGESFFRILGTSADDTKSQPHVMSPPLMESLLNFVPDQVAEANFLLKFSLVRDGASITTLRELCKNSQYTFLAVETTDGDVFGSFTGTPWHLAHSFFGTGESFLWKMRYNRMTPCFSLVEQAQLESDIDVFPFSGLNYGVQLCTDKAIAVGGGSLEGSLESMDYGTNSEIERTLDKENGFGIVLNEDLSSGSTSPCGTFTNPSLVCHSGKAQDFKVLNLEVWALTPCASVKEAEHMEKMASLRAESFRSSGSLSVRRTNSIDSKKSGISSVFKPQDYLRESLEK